MNSTLFYFNVCNYLYCKQSYMYEGTILTNGVVGLPLSNICQWSIVIITYLVCIDTILHHNMALCNQTYN